MILEQIGKSICHAVFAWIVSSIVKGVWNNYLRNMRRTKPFISEQSEKMDKSPAQRNSKASTGEMPFHVLCWLVAAPFFCMLLTPYLINAGRKLYNGNHHLNFYVRSGGGIFSDSPTIYGIEFSPSDFLELDGPYYLAVPIW
jgi:hypothetical protein